MPDSTWRTQILLQYVRDLCRSWRETGERPLPNDQGLDLKEVTAVVGWTELDKLRILHDVFATEPVWSAEELYKQLSVPKDDAD